MIQWMCIVHFVLVQQSTRTVFQTSLYRYIVHQTKTEFWNTSPLCPAVTIIYKRIVVIIIHIADVRFAEQVWCLWRNNQSYKKKIIAIIIMKNVRMQKSRVKKKFVGINNIGIFSVACPFVLWFFHPKTRCRVKYPPHCAKVIDMKSYLF